jgi:hypothetical protein
MMVLRLTNPVLSDMCYSLQKHVDRCVACPTGSKEFFIRHLKINNCTGTTVLGLALCNSRQ